MKRRHLVELEDLPWWPRLFRDAATDYLVAALRHGKTYVGLAPRLGAAVKRTGAARITDLCPGGGGPWPDLLPALAAAGTLLLANVSFAAGFVHRVHRENGIMGPSYRGGVGWALLLVCCSPAWGQPGPVPYEPPRDIAFRKATVISEGTRVAAELFALKGDDSKALPTVIMCHGWGGVAEQLRPDALAFARAGYFVVTFDYRGWGASEGRVVLTRPAARGKPGEPFTAEVKEIREVVDPLDQATDLLNVIHWVQGEKQCDPERIGLWGTSYSGGHVVYAAARDPRVKATVSQVPGMDSRFVMAGPGRRQTFEEATKRARGEIGYPEPGATAVGNLKGAPVRERLMNYAPVEEAAKAPACAMLFVIAEKEELFDNRDHGIKAYERAKGPKKLATIPGISHYGIYGEGRAQAQKLAIAWYDAHLKGVPPTEAPGP